MEILNVVIIFSKIGIIVFVLVVVEGMKNVSIIEMIIVLIIIFLVLLLIIDNIKRVSFLCKFVFCIVVVKNNVVVMRVIVEVVYLLNVNDNVWLVFRRLFLVKIVLLFFGLFSFFFKFWIGLNFKSNIIKLIIKVVDIGYDIVFVIYIIIVKVKIVSIVLVIIGRFEGVGSNSIIISIIKFMII